MALEINKMGKVDGKQWESACRIYLNSSRDKVVPGGSKEARFLLAAKGDRIPLEEATRLGLFAPAKPQDKAGKPAENKALAGAGKP